MGIGYVGLATAIMFSEKNDVTICDVQEKKVKAVNSQEPPFWDENIDEFFQHNTHLRAENTENINYQIYDYIILAVPTNFDKEHNDLDTSIVEDIINKLATTNATIVIRSTISYNFALKIKNEYATDQILYCPEFLREGTAIYDVSHPSRIIIGGNRNLSMQYVNLITSAINLLPAKIHYVSIEEAAAIKLFANSYLALRVAFFNELDSFALLNNMNSKKCIDGVCSDDRIGNYYNNPSFGFGGGCLPKDTKSLENAMQCIPNSLISAITESNNYRKRIIFNEIVNLNHKIIGIYRLNFKSASDNLNNSSSLDICDYLVSMGKCVIIYEPIIDSNYFHECAIIKDLQDFLNRAEIILANRCDESLYSVREKVFTRDIFNQN